MDEPVRYRRQTYSEDIHALGEYFMSAVDMWHRRLIAATSSELSLLFYMLLHRALNCFYNIANECFFLRYPNKLRYLI